MRKFRKFREWVSFREMAAQEVEAALAHIDYRTLKPENMPFNEMFKGNFRLIIPIESEVRQKVEEELVRKGYEVQGDLALKTVQTQRGPKKQSNRLTSIIKKELGQEVLDHYNKEAGWSVMISRHPKDVMRMSDFKHLASCHSPESLDPESGAGVFWRCIAEEIRDYGVVAYVIPTSKAKSIDLNADEVLQDDIRGIKGIVPHTRGRLRTLMTKDGNRILAAEPTLYGNDIKSPLGRKLFDTMKNWVLEDQGQKSAYDSLSDFNDLKPLGGTYYDTPYRFLAHKMKPTNKSIGIWSLIDVDENNKKIYLEIDPNIVGVKMGYVLSKYVIEHLKNISNNIKVEINEFNNDVIIISFGQEDPNILVEKIKGITIPNEIKRLILGETLKNGYQLIRGKYDSSYLSVFTKTPKAVDSNTARYVKNYFNNFLRKLSGTASMNDSSMIEISFDISNENICQILDTITKLPNISTVLQDIPKTNQLIGIWSMINVDNENQLINLEIDPNLISGKLGFLLKKYVVDLLQKISNNINVDVDFDDNISVELGGEDPNAIVQSIKGITIPDEIKKLIFGQTLRNGYTANGEENGWTISLNVSTNMPRTDENTTVYIINYFNKLLKLLRPTVEVENSILSIRFDNSTLNSKTIQILNTVVQLPNISTVLSQSKP